ncbi:MAG: SAM-dependent methyltransferase [bacterium]|jgi:methyl halide transferase
MKKFSAEYWNHRYLQNMTGWDIGYASKPIAEYIDQLENRELKILVPGAGNAYEVEHLYHKGFTNTYLLDFSEQSILNFLSRCPDFPASQLIKEDFFDFHGHFDLIIEQTFFSSIPREKRHLYAVKMHDLLTEKGKLTGLLWAHEFDFDGPPFGGNKDEYQQLFSPLFHIESMDISYNSIRPRQERELFIKLRKKGQ